MTDDERSYCDDLIRTAENHLTRARALLNDADRMLATESALAGGSPA